MPKGFGERSAFFQLERGCLDKVIAYRQIGKIDPHVGSFGGPGDIVSAPVPVGNIVPEISRIDDAGYIFHPLQKTFKVCLIFTPWNIVLLIVRYHSPLLKVDDMLPVITQFFGLDQLHLPVDDQDRYDEYGREGKLKDDQPFYDHQLRERRDDLTLQYNGRG